MKCVQIQIVWIVATLAAIEPAARAQTPTAEDLYAEGQAAYNRTDYAAAITKWQASYGMSGESGLLFNLAQAYRLSGDCPRALATYRHFMTADPAADQRPLAEDLAGELEGQCGKRVPPPPPPPKPAPAPPTFTGPEDHATRPGRTLRITGLVTGSTGAALLVTGLLFGHRAQAIGSEVTDACALSCDWDVQKSRDAAGRRNAKIGYALDVVGVAAIASGAVLYYIGSKSAVTIAPTPRADGASVSWSGSW